MVGDSQKRIVHLLNAYFQQLNSEKQFRWWDGHVHAEYFFKDLFNLICGCRLNHVSIKGNPNAEAIDLFSDKDELVIQITGQTTKINDKISGTLKKYERSWQSKYKSLVIFFINPSDKIKHGEKPTAYSTIWTSEGVISHINNLSAEKRERVLDFLLIELADYNNKEKHLKALRPFEIEKQSTILTIAPSEFDEQNDLLFYLDSEIQLVDEIVNEFTLTRTSDSLLIGPPCIGKTTLMLLLSKKLKEKLIKTFYYDVKSNYDIGAVETDIYRIRSHDCVLIVDNAYQDDELALKIIRKSNSASVRTLFISRNRHVTSPQKIEYFIQGKVFRLKEPSPKDFDYKAKGIINKRIKYLKKELPNYSWSIGNIGAVLSGLENNLLKLSLKLFQWTKEYPEYPLDQIEDSKLIENFLETQIKLTTDEEAIQLYLFSFLYKMDYQFHLKRQNTFVSNLIANGTIIAQNPNSKYFSFYHTEYANLLHKGIQQKYDYSKREIETFVVKYISENLPRNINSLLNKLIYNNEFNIIKAILLTKSTREFLTEQYLSKVLLNDLIFLIEYCSSTRDKELTEFVLEIATNEKLNIPIHEKDGERLYTTLKSIENYTPRKLSLNRKANFESIFYTNSFYNISHILMYRTLSFHDKSSFVQMFSFSEWLEKFNAQRSEIGSISGGLSNLASLPQGKQLAQDLYESLSTEEIYDSIKSAEIDVIGKSLSELNKLNPFDRDNKPQKVLKLLIENGYLDYREYWGLTKFAISASHLSAIQTSINEMFPSEDSLKKLFEDISANEIANQIFELVKAFPEKRDILLETLEKTINSEAFQLNPRNNLAGLFILKSLLQSLEFQTSLFSKISSLIESKIRNEKDVVIITNSFKQFKKELKNLKIDEFINSKSVSDYLKERKQLGSLEVIFSNLNAYFGNRKFSAALLKEIPIAVIVNSIKNPSIKLESISKVITILNGIDRTYTESVLTNAVDFVRTKMKVASMSDQILAYSRFHKIAPKLTESNLDNILTESLTKKNFEGESLSMLFQAIRKLVETTASSINYKSLCHDFLERNRNDITLICENLDLAKISTGLCELAYIFPEISKDYIRDIEHILLKKAEFEGKRANFATQILPELMRAGAETEFIKRLKSKISN